MKKTWTIAAFVLISAIVIAFVRTWTGDWPYPSEVRTLEQKGQFGDSFAVFSATFSALGFLGVVLTLALQQLQISQQTRELKRQAERDEANRRRDEIAQYEQLLFRLLDYYKQSVDSVRIVRKGVEAKGRDALSLVLQQMQLELRRRKLHFIPERELAPIRSSEGSEVQRLLLDYVTVETCRVIQYTVVYQRRVIATLHALLEHLESRCPDELELPTYRALVASQITHIEVQYIFAVALVHESEAELRKLLQQSGLLAKDAAPYNFKFHQFLYKHLWGYEAGDPSRARRLAFRPKRSAQIRVLASLEPLSSLLAKYEISPPFRPESLAETAHGDSASDKIESH